MKKGLVFLCFLICYQLQSQSEFSFGWLPKLNLTKKLSDKTKWVNSIEARELLYDDEFQFSHKLVDVTSVFSMKLNSNQSFNAGYIIRFSDGNTVHRFLQHYNFIEKLGNFKFANRLGFEQFFSKHNKAQYRTRYRATFQRALNGERIDVKEFYIKIANEYLYQFNKDDFEVRLSPYLGYQLSKNEKLEFGLDYRLGRVFATTQKQSLWFRTTWYIIL